MRQDEMLLHVSMLIAQRAQEPAELGCMRRQILPDRPEVHRYQPEDLPAPREL
jgi:hypothetical protein